MGKGDTIKARFVVLDTLFKNKTLSVHATLKGGTSYWKTELSLSKWLGGIISNIIKLYSKHF